MSTSSKPIDGYVNTALNGIYDNLLNTGDGGRNTTLFKEATNAYEFVYGGYAQESEVTQTLINLAESIGLERGEINDTLKSARISAAKQPRVIPEQKPTIDVSHLFKQLPKDEDREKKFNYSISEYNKFKNNSAENHPYLAKKKLLQHSKAFFTGRDKGGDFIAHKLYSKNMEFAGYERIYSNGKKVSAGANYKGVYFGAFLGTNKDKCYITEGAADALSIVESTNCDCYSATSAGNIGKVADIMKDRYQTVICAFDNDKAGLKAAGELNGKFECVVPSSENDYSDVFVSGGDMLAELQNKPPKAENKDNDLSFTLDDFVMNTDQIAQRLDEMKNHSFVLDELAIMGQITIFYAPPNSGKTLLTLALVIDAVKNSKVKGEDVFYINADDGGSGAMTKAQILSNYRIKPITLSENGFTPEKLEGALSTMCAKNEARGKVIIIDTMKKFTDVMSKTSLSQFMAVLRKFAMSGGTAIALAHTNKKRDVEGKVIFGGTSDSMDDTDCAYSLDVVGESQGTRMGILMEMEIKTITEKRTVLLENLKKRGDNDKEASYQYEVWKGAKYEEMLNSVRRVDNETAIKQKHEHEKLAREQEKKERLRDDALELYEFIISNGGSMLKTELYSEAPKETVLPRRKVRQCLDIFEGEYWRIRKEVSSQYVEVLNRPEMILDDDI